jgi:hypothetical protein
MRAALLTREKGSEEMYEVVFLDGLDEKERPRFGNDLFRYVLDNYDLETVEVIYIDCYENCLEEVKELDLPDFWIDVFSIDWSFNLRISEDGMETVTDLDGVITCQRRTPKWYIWVRWQGGEWMKLEKPYDVSSDLPMALCGDVLVDEGYDVLLVTSLKEPPDDEIEDEEEV